MKKRALLASVLMAFMIMLIGLQTGYSAPITIRFSSGAPESHFLTKQYIEWGKLIETNSKGGIKVQVYHSAQLFRDNEVIKAVQTGALESGCAFTMYSENQLVPAMKVFQFPFLFQALDDTMKVYRSEVGTAWKATAERKGVKILGLVVFPAPEDHIILTSKPVRVPADIKGMVIRGASPEHALAIKKWGAGPSFLTGAEVYLALQRGTINGAINSLLTYMERKLYEVSPHAIFMPLSAVHTFIVMNKSVFDRLAPEQQKIILDASMAIENNTVPFALKTFKEDLEEAKKKAKLYYPTHAELSLWKEGMSPIWDDLAKTNEEVSTAFKNVRTILNR
jgi:C4-dicarboxylate-binding protein DctP